MLLRRRLSDSDGFLLLMLLLFIIIIRSIGLCFSQSGRFLLMENIAKAHERNPSNEMHRYRNGIHGQT